MRSLILNEAVWSGTNSNMTHMHAFLNGTTAACNARIKPGDSVRSGDMPLTSMAKRNANTLPTTWCEKCEAKVTAMVNRREASMAPSTGEEDHLPPAAEVAEPVEDPYRELPEETAPEPERVPADPEMRAEIADVRTILSLIRTRSLTPGQWEEIRAAVTAARDRLIQVDNARRTDPKGA